MTKTKMFAALAGAAALALALAGCSGSSSGADSSGSGDEPLKIGLIMLQGDTYYQGIQSGLEEAVQADGGSVTTGLSNNDPATENQVAQNMIQAKVDAILMQPTADEASIATMQAIKDAGIALICYGNCIGPTTDPELVDGVIQSDNTALGTGTGEAAAKYIEENLGGTVNLAILNCDIASACKLRKAGFLDALEAAGITVNILTDQEAYLVDKATTVTTDILTANADADMIWASNEGGTAGATIAVAAGRQEDPGLRHRHLAAARRVRPRRGRHPAGDDGSGPGRHRAGRLRDGQEGPRRRQERPARGRAARASCTTAPNPATTEEFLRRRK